jgi:hypothetical protein
MVKLLSAPSLARLQLAQLSFPEKLSLCAFFLVLVTVKICDRWYTSA